MLLGLALAVASTLAIADDPVGPDAKADYASYCASCHGIDGTGNGPLAESLKIKPTDLTVISKKNQGHFPYTMLRKTIEGTELGLARAHGPRDMPVWSPVFRQEPEAVIPGGVSAAYGAGLTQCIHLAARARIMNIVDYIESIQK
jgi:mono/diheme cytochrome c family protein